jgi:hypothetical protein
MQVKELASASKYQESSSAKAGDGRGKEPTHVSLCDPSCFSAAIVAAMVGFYGNVSSSVIGVIPVAHAQAAVQFSGFADIVEKVKPAVISVRVRIDVGGSLVDDGSEPLSSQESPLERFFRRMVRGYIALQIQEVTPEIAENLGRKYRAGNHGRSADLVVVSRAVRGRDAFS